MRFMTIVKSAENQGPPPRELMEAIAQAAQEATGTGTMLQAGGLVPSTQGVEVRVAGGRLTVTDGPYVETKEVIGGFAIFEMDSKEEAVQAAKDFMELHRMHWPGWEGVTEVRQMIDNPGEVEQG